MVGTHKTWVPSFPVIGPVSSLLQTLHPTCEMGVMYFSSLTCCGHEIPQVCYTVTCEVLVDVGAPITLAGWLLGSLICSSWWTCLYWGSRLLSEPSQGQTGEGTCWHVPGVLPWDQFLCQSPLSLPDPGFQTLFAY